MDWNALQDLFCSFSPLKIDFCGLEADSALKAAMQAMAETNTTTSGNITSLTELLRNAKLRKAAEGYIQKFAGLTKIVSLHELNFPSLQTRITNVENNQVTKRSDVSSIKEMVIEMFNSFKGVLSSTPSGSSAIPTFILLEATVTVKGENSKKQAHMEKEEQMERAAQEEKLMALSKPELIKVVEEVAIETEVDQKALCSSKGGQEF
nr:hypothetical protein [Tanacetum cinerariifolium]